MEKVKPVILIICDYYLPGFESGGAMRTLVNMIERLGDGYRFKLITRDHDGPLNKNSYTNVSVNEWNLVENTEVYYLSRDNIRVGRIRQLINETKPDAIYVSSFFSPLTVFSLLLRRFNRIGPVPIVLAPEDELGPGSMSLKASKKLLYIRAAKLLNLFNIVVWKAASETEKKDIEARFGTGNDIFIGPNMPPRMILANFDQNMKPHKTVGQASMVFISRFGRKKNFNWLLDHIRPITGELSIDIYGPLEDAEYWRECEALIKTLPANVTIEAKGPVPHEDVAATLGKYQFFVLPTLGENFGHIFVEALAAGCPLIISDRTPWRDLETKGVGWDIPLEDPQKWLGVFNTCLVMDNDAYREMSQRARDFAVGWLSDPKLEESNRKVLDFALAEASK